jgi:DNA segregation ATPase FtsK/SpoIIIE, S-DNA-T family
VAAQRSKKAQKKSSSVARRSPKGSTTSESVWARHKRDIWVIILAVLGVASGLAEVHALGPYGKWTVSVLSDVLGIARFVLPVIFIGFAVVLLSGRVEVERARFSWGFALAIVAVAGIADVANGRPSFAANSRVLGSAGGWLGTLTGGTIASGIGTAGAVVVLLAMATVALMVLTGTGLKSLLSTIGQILRRSWQFFTSWWSSRPTRAEKFEPPTPTPKSATVAEVVANQPFNEDDSDIESGEPSVEEFEAEDEFTAEYETEVIELESEEPLEGHAEHEVSLPSTWELPPTSLLARTREQKLDKDSVDSAGAQLVEALAAHGVDTSLVGYTVGPAVTRFELELGPGVKVSKLTSLNRDIAYAMASPDVRILAPIPGRQAIGVEVPNRQRSLVALGDMMIAEETVQANHPLDVPIGRDISGKTVVVNLGQMPHVLISGATGAGKSSCINSLISALVMRATPDELGLILVDPKRVEMGQYGDLPHLLMPVVVDPKKAAGALHWAVKEMERRYDILAATGARDITSYQQMVDNGQVRLPPTLRKQVVTAIDNGAGTGFGDSVDNPSIERLPYIVIVVDELNDLMMVAARDVEESVVRIAQMARAVGIHLVLATQRPSVDVITGVIKANVPSRIAFAVSSLADSRVILDQAGAERLIGKGDMLLLTASSNVARRIQSPWVSEDEVRSILEFWRAQGGRREPIVALDELPIRNAASPSSGSSGGDDDEMLRQARRLVVENQLGSTSMLQRKLRVGFARAGRLMDLLEEEKVVGPADGSKSRKVLMTLDELNERGL